MKVLYLIPARGGSKGLPGKNKMMLGKYPLITWSVLAAKNCNVKGDIVVSTDDPEIAEIAKKSGAEVPFIRPSGLATDTSSAMDVVFHAIDWLEKQQRKYDLIVLLQPTSPFRSTEDIHLAIESVQNDVHAVVGVTVCQHHPLWTNVLPENKMMGNFIRPEIKNLQRQQLPVYYQINGAIYVSRVDYLRSYQSFVGPQTKAYVMPSERSVDIDTIADFKLAEFYLQEYNFQF